MNKEFWESSQEYLFRTVAMIKTENITVYKGMEEDE